MKELKHKLFRIDSEKELLKFVNSETIKVVSITQAKNNDYNLFYR
jgi:hypothetical protein